MRAPHPDPTRRAHPGLVAVAAAVVAVLGASPAFAQSPPGAQPSPLAKRPWSASVIAGSSIAINGLNYKLGVGVRGGVHFRNVYLGGLVLVHQGDTKTIAWGPTAFGAGGDQKYTSHPFFLAADAGYSLELPLGPVDSVLTPCLSGGVLLITMDSSGVYGSPPTLSKTYGLFGFGASYGLLVDERVFAGVHFRLYDTGDTSFEFGNFSQGTYQHGFSTSIFYYALYAELGYRF